MRPDSPRWLAHVAPWLLAAGGLGALGCQGSSSAPPGEARETGQTEFVSAAPGQGGRGSAELGGGPTAGGRDTSADASAPSANGGAAGNGKDAGGDRAVEETDLYRLEGDKLYFLNAYRGLLVFDVADVDHPHLVGRSPIYGSPVEMIVRNGVATVVVADWYGKMDDGTPFHGSVVRGLDARDPKDIRVLGEARLGGWVRDTRVVGDVLYAVSEDYGELYGPTAGVARGDGVASSTDAAVGGSTGGATTASGPRTLISSVSFAGGKIAQKGLESFPGWGGGIFHVSQDAILLAHGAPYDNTARPGEETTLEYVDIRDPKGTIARKGSFGVKGYVQGWGADNGRWNLDFSEDHYARIFTQGPYPSDGSIPPYILTTVDFRDPAAPTKASELLLPNSQWSSPTVRFDQGRLYLASQSYDSAGYPENVVRLLDVRSPEAPKEAGSLDIPGYVWNFIPSGDQLFALGQGGENSSQVSLFYLDVSDLGSPKVLGTSTFGEGWAWTPAAGTFKAFTKDADKGLVVLPFSGWSYESNRYANGLQLIEYSPSTLTTKGTASTKGWVERGIFVKDRLVSLSDLSLAVIDYADRDKPAVVSELTLARNVVSAVPLGEDLAMLSTDWWGYDSSSSELRVLPVSEAEENSEVVARTAIVEGTNARLFRHGDLSYVASYVYRDVPCAQVEGSTGAMEGGSKPVADAGTAEPGATADGSAGSGSEPASTCQAWTTRIQVVDLAGGEPVLRGSVELPVDQGYYYGGYGWGGCYWYDWFDGSAAVQVGGDALAFRRFEGAYDAAGRWSPRYRLTVVDLSNPDAPSLASTLVADEASSWWGNVRAVGDTLYASHVEWIDADTADGQAKVKFYLERFDLSDRAHPKVSSRLNVPGFLVGASEDDPSLVYTLDYRWDGDSTTNELAVVRLGEEKATLLGALPLEGWVGNVFVRGSTAYASVYSPVDGSLRLHAIDLSEPSTPVDRASESGGSGGWLLGVEGDRAILTSGWGDAGVDIFRLEEGKAPTFDQFVRTRGWWPSSLARQGDRLFLSSGYWGVQVIDLN